jgi:prepilin-type N-terminal cleavage/methylation domain-containing protein
MMVRKSGKPKAESRDSVDAQSTRRVPPSAFRFPLSAIPKRGITLIELLITITIIAIISAAILGTAAAAMEASRRSRTQSIITKLNGLLLERWDSYATRRVSVNPDITSNTQIPTSIEAMFLNGQITAVERGQMLMDARLLALRELMMMEMPDRWSDVVNQEMQDNVDLRNVPTILDATPAITQTYRRQLGAIQQGGADLETVLQNQRAECLYLIIMNFTGDGEARTHFTAQDIGDTDEDGAPEFLDGWGKPIEWIRWPAGFVLQSELMVEDADGDHDPFDVFRRDSPGASPTVVPPTAPQTTRYPQIMQFDIQLIRDRNDRAARVTSADQAILPHSMMAFRLVPLIYSAGPDDAFALLLSQNVDAPEQQMPLDPYYENPDEGYQSGTPDPEDDAWRDNIHNHLIEF